MDSGHQISNGRNNTEVFRESSVAVCWNNSVNASEELEEKGKTSQHKDIINV